jgi:Uncharacterized protein related to plant photosystem II stability/assembly factor
MKKLLHLVYSLLLVACGAVTPVAAPHTNIPSIQFQSPSITKRDVVAKEGLDLVVGVFAASKNIVFLFGSMMARDGEFQPMQSTLLRSDDGGAHWKEVMSPISNATVREFTMLESGIGWALVFNHIPPSYKYTLFQTTDYGINWQEVAIIPLSSKEFPLALQMIFVDELHGQIDLLYQYSYLEFLTTNDGGTNWKQSGTYQPEFEGNTPTGEILGSYHALIKDKNESFSLDHSGVWTLNGAYGNPDVNVIVIQHQQFTDDGPPTTREITVPKHFDYMDGQIIVQQ